MGDKQEAGLRSACAACKAARFRPERRTLIAFQELNWEDLLLVVESSDFLKFYQPQIYIHSRTDEKKGSVSS